jgi:hypothetical protein
MNEASKDCKICLGTGLKMSIDGESLGSEELLNEPYCDCVKEGDPDRNYVVQDPDLK